MTTVPIAAQAAGLLAAAGSEAVEAPWFVSLTYMAAAVSFILALKWLSAPKTARHGVWIGEIGMVLAVVGTLVSHQIIKHYTGIFVAFAVGTAVGVPLAVFMPMTAVPQRTALSHAFKYDS